MFNSNKKLLANIRLAQAHLSIFALYTAKGSFALYRALQVGLVTVQAARCPQLLVAGGRLLVSWWTAGLRDQR